MKTRDTDTFRFSEKQWQEMGSKLLDLGNFALSGLVFTQILTENELNIITTTFGITCFGCSYMIGFILIGKGGEVCHSMG